MILPIRNCIQWSSLNSFEAGEPQSYSYTIAYSMLHMHEEALSVEELALPSLTISAVSYESLVIAA